MAPPDERLLAWLHHARDALDAPELDRLYGELSKLQQLACLPISDEVLDARVQQALTLAQCRGWKHLARK